MTAAYPEGPESLVEAAHRTIERAWRPGTVTVGAAALGTSGEIHVGVNVDTVGYGPCAEAVVLGAALAAGEEGIRTLVAVAWSPEAERGRVIPPCGNCRQLLLDHSPDATIVLADDGELAAVALRDLLPRPYRRPLLERRDR